MIVYGFLSGLLLFYSVLMRYCNLKTFQALTIAFISLLSIIIGYRYPSIGTDTENYIEFFNSVPSELSYSFVFGNGSPLFQIVIFFLAKIGATPSFFLFVCSFILNILLFNCSRKLSSLGPFFFLVFVCSFTYFLLSLNILRQGLAVIAFLNFVIYKESNNQKLSYGYLFLSLLFHPSSILIFLIYFIVGKFKFNFILATAVIASSLTVSVLGLDIASVLINLIKFINIMPNIVYRLEYYVTGYDVAGSVVGVGYLVTCSIALISLFLSEKIRENEVNILGFNGLFDKSLSLTFVNVLIYPILAPYAALSRLSFYFYPFEMLLFCLIVSCLFSKKSIKTFVISFIAFVLYLKAVVSGVSYGFL